MKLTKAIEILDLNIKEAGKKMPPDCRDAVQMGIEGLREIKTIRAGKQKVRINLLPGETEEN